MSTSPPPPAPVPSLPPAPGATPQQIKVISHSMLFYWWPVWFFGFLFALITFIDNKRMAIVESNSTVTFSRDEAKKINEATIHSIGENDRLYKDSAKNEKGEEVPKIRVSPRSWLGPVFFTVIFLIILITSIPLRGLWSLVMIILIALLAVVFSLFEIWDPLLKALGDLHVFINMAGYLAMGTAVLIAWVLSVFVFDRRTYIIFTPGQVRVCEEIGGREKVYDTTNLSLEKKRDDWFRHIILGFGTGDMNVKTAGADRHEIQLPNVAFIGFKIEAIEQLLRSRQTQPRV
jgi:hypothetical protein